MVDNTGWFNAPSREMIYKRAMKIAFGDSWTYHYDDFVTFDSSCKIYDASETKAQGNAPRQDFVPLAPPVVKIRNL